MGRICGFMFKEREKTAELRELLGLEVGTSQLGDGDVVWTWGTWRQYWLNQVLYDSGGRWTRQKGHMRKTWSDVVKAIWKVLACSQRKHRFETNGEGKWMDQSANWRCACQPVTSPVDAEDPYVWLCAFDRWRVLEVFKSIVRCQLLDMLNNLSIYILTLFTASCNVKKLIMSLCKIYAEIVKGSCGLQEECPTGKYSYLIRSGVEKDGSPTVCFNGHLYVNLFFL